MRVPLSSSSSRLRGDERKKRMLMNGWIHGREAVLMMQAYDWQGALEKCQRMLSVDPDHLGALETLAQAQWHGGQFNAVIATTSRLLRLNPCEPGYRYTRGMAHLSKGELALAAEDFRMAITMSNNASFKEQVESSLHALERWMVESPSKPGKLGGMLSSPLGRLN